MALNWRKKVDAIFLLGTLIVIPLLSVLIFSASHSQYAYSGTHRGEQVNYWWLIFLRTASLSGFTTCSWAALIILVMLIISVADLIRHHVLTKIGTISFLLATSAFLCSSSYAVGAISNEGTLIDHIHSTDFKGEVYQLAYEGSVVDPELNGFYIVYACQPPGLWCRVVTSIGINKSRSTNLYEYGSFVVEYNKLYAKVGQDMVLIST